MRSQFRDMTELFKRGPRLAAKALAFAAKVAERSPKGDMRPWMGKVFAAPAANAADWDGMFHDVPCAFLISTDGCRLHATVAPATYVNSDTPPYEGRPDIAPIVDAAVARPSTRAWLNARYLREAIYPAAEEVLLSLPTEEGQAVVVTSLTGDGAQLAWAAIMPLNLRAGYKGHESYAPRLAAVPEQEPA